MERAAGITPPETESARRRRRRRWIVLAVVAVLLVAGGIWGAGILLRTCGSLGSGVEDIDGACVGVTDGAYTFHPELADIQKKIADENKRVRADPRGYVSVALLDPLTATVDSALPPQSVRSRLEGAYTALRRVNHERVAGDENPQIQLLLANQGSTDDQWTHVFDRLRELSGAEEHPLVAVVGLGVSTARTQSQAGDLSRAGIPMVGAVLTADTLEYDRVPGLIKASPSNRHYVAALRDYLDSIGLDSAIMVRDSNSDAGFDLYTSTLETAFDEQMADVIKYETQQFTGRSGSGTSPPSLFGNVQANICSAAGDKGVAVLYAGREIDLGDLLESLEHRTCRSTPLTVLTAGLELGKVLRGKDLRGARLTVLNAATVDALGWHADTPGSPDGYREFYEAFADTFPADHLDDGGAIMMHDALLTATQAVRMAAPHGSASPVTAAAVRTQLLNVNTQYVVRGASGTLSFSKKPSGTDTGGTGIPEGKPIPVLQYPNLDDPSLPSQQVGRLCSVADGPALVRCG